MTRASIATAIGVLGLGGLVIANSGRVGNASPQAAAVVDEGRTATAGPTVVDCGEGREAVVHSTLNGGSRVQCVPSGAAAQPLIVTPAATPFATQYAPAEPAPVRTVVQERVVYRDRPVAYRSAAHTVSAAPVSTSRSEAPARQARSWRRSAAIIGGTTAGGAGVGAVLGGRRGAAKGAVVGLVGGTVYDIATRNR